MEETTQEQRQQLLEEAAGLLASLKEVVIGYHDAEENISSDTKMEVIALALAHATAITLSYGVCCREHFEEVVQVQTKNVLSIGRGLLEPEDETRH